MSAPALDTWPFFAPSRADAIDAALDLAGAGPGTGIVDLGCGDGQILLAASRRGATVGGIDADPDLVAEARRNLRSVGVDADVRTGDLFAPDLDLDLDGVDETVLVAYLAPATLQRLVPRLARDRGRRLVTIDFDVPGLVPTEVAGPARLYRFPCRRRRLGAPGWPAAGTMIAVAPECQSLSCLDLVHPAGPTRVRTSRNLAGLVSVLAGADELDAPARLAVDLRWEPLDEGTTAIGAIRCAGVEDHVLVMCVTEEEGMWDLSADAVDNLRRALRRNAPPTTIADLLEVAES